MGLPTVEFTRRGLVVRAAFHADRTPRFAAAMKRHIPRPDRRYDEARFIWRVTTQHFDRVRAVMREAWGEFQVIGDPDAGDYIESADGTRAAQQQLF